ncbi:MAG: tRNA adenosine(34) deaminase TadA [Clostridia bacterium]|nr:tRNA adenosine(34) deaminase TadA [Clostridia bacterium]
MHSPETLREQTVARILSAYDSVPDSPHEADAYWMSAALALAQQAALEGEVPVGCVLVRDGKILTGDYNGRETFRDPLYHAESAAIRKASRLLGGWRLTRCTLYVTLEPCPMCAGAVWAARVERVVIGAKDAKAGAMGSLLNLISYPLNHKPSVTFGVMEKEARALLQEFFAARRNRT